MKHIIVKKLKKIKVCCGKQWLERIKRKYHLVICEKKRIGRIGRDTHVICSELLSWTSPVYWMQHVIQTHFVSMFSALKKEWRVKKYYLGVFIILVHDQMIPQSEYYKKIRCNKSQWKICTFINRLNCEEKVHKITKERWALEQELSEVNGSSSLMHRPINNYCVWR